MEVYFLVVLTSILALILVFFDRKSIISIRCNPWSIIFYKEILFILPSVFLVVIFGVDYFKTFYLADQNKTFLISCFIIYVLFSFSLSLVFLSFFGFDIGRIYKYNLSFSLNDHYRIRVFGYAVIIVAIFLLIFSMLFLGYKHAFLSTILTGENLIHVRLNNTYNSSLPTQVSYVFAIAIGISSIFSVYLFYYFGRFQGVIVFVACLILSTADGAKGTLLNVFVFMLSAYFYFYNPKVKFLKVLFKLFVFLFFSLTILFYVLSLQVPDLDLPRFINYLIERVGVGQMAGVYEALSVELSSFQYGWHTIPFASLYVDYPIFSKDLMLLSEGGTASSVGVKNSLFVSEAFGIGGWPLAYLAPWLFGFSYVVKSFIIYFSLNILFSNVVAKLYSLPLLFISTKLTGDFSSIIFQKGTILLLITFVVFYLSVFFVKFFIKK